MAVVSTVASRGLVASQPVVSAIRFRRYRTVFGCTFNIRAVISRDRKHGRVVLTLAKQIGIDAVNQFMPCILIAEQRTFR